jgi:predicted transcriptional regulator
MYEFYVKEKITTALKAAENGKVISHDEVKKRFLPK